MKIDLLATYMGPTVLQEWAQHLGTCSEAVRKMSRPPTRLPSRDTRTSACTETSSWGHGPGPGFLPISPAAQPQVKCSPQRASATYKMQMTIPCRGSVRKERGKGQSDRPGSEVDRAGFKSHLCHCCPSRLHLRCGGCLVNHRSALIRVQIQGLWPQGGAPTPDSPPVPRSHFFWCKMTRKVIVQMGEAKSPSHL